MSGSDLILPPHGGYRKLRSFVVALAAYDGTVIFCDRFVDLRSRTHDQMVQAARSGPQNIAEGSVASATSKKTELKLTGVARASLGELIRDYEDYLTQHGLQVWEKDSERVRLMRARLAGKLKPDVAQPQPPVVKGRECYDEPLRAALAAIRKGSSEVCANILLCLAHQASYLLRRQLERLERDFLEQGGITERLYRCRKEHRDNTKKRDPERPE
ncbi:four helix bundle suffix domain-containing protein [Geomonas sp. RF6]|uniref:four helix bundle suffix domain-containing protein n=1 Tax=Geomonas sp. RF6 TaxID=2897342 RepID=UPI001E32D84E|nr:four helix bundle suffix domain-containing protein [Geomonas sp. RF6]UFS72344.1 four helix bundle suffix domain-containing protein [Geomonas sp. RF6]